MVLLVPIHTLYSVHLMHGISLLQKAGHCLKIIGDACLEKMCVFSLLTALLQRKAIATVTTTTFSLLFRELYGPFFA